MKSTPRVSVGMPVFNGEDYLDRALRSVTQQDFEDLEIIVSDNASTDGTEEICREWVSRDPRVGYVRHEANRGGAWNHQFVVSQATGPFFRYHAHDDECKPTMTSRLVELLDSNEDVVMSHANTEMIDEDGRVFAVYDDNLRAGSDRPHERLWNLLRRLFYCNANYGLVRTAAIRDTRGHGAYLRADHVQLAELVLRGKFACHDEPLFRRRFHSRMSTSGATIEERAAWFDPSRSSRRVHFPVARLYAEHLRAIYLSPLPVTDRLRCYAAFNFYSTAWLSQAILRKLSGRPLLEIPVSRLQKTPDFRDEDFTRLRLW